MNHRVRVLHWLLDCVFQSREVHKPGGLYLKRWFLTPLSWLREWPWWLRWVPPARRKQVFLHNIRLPDERVPHSHPWPFKTRLLAGSYVETWWRTVRYWDENRRNWRKFIAPQGQRVLRRGDVMVSDLDHVHYVTVVAPVWSLVVAGRPEREWGFWVDANTWVNWRDFLGLPENTPDSPEDAVVRSALR